MAAALLNAQGLAGVAISDRDFQTIGTAKVSYQLARSDIAVGSADCVDQAATNADRNSGIKVGRLSLPISVIIKRQVGDEVPKTIDMQHMQAQAGGGGLGLRDAQKHRLSQWIAHLMERGSVR